MIFEDCIFYDIETIPAPDRFRLPEPRQNSNEDLVDLATKPIATIKEKLAILSLSELKLLEEVETFDKNRSSLLTSIKSEIKKLLTEPEMAIKAASVNPWLCNIVCCAWHDLRNDEKTVIMATNEKEEKQLIKSWSKKVQHRLRVSWGGLRFDDPVFLVRSTMLNVQIPPVNLSPNWKNDQHTDLSQLLFNAKLDDVAKCLGIINEYGMNGSDVYNAYMLKRYDEISEYCLFDVEKLRQVASRFSGKICV